MISNYLPEALSNLLPNGGWQCINNDSKKIKFEDYILDEDKPTEQEIKTEIESISSEFIATQYKRDRAKAYPSVKDQLDKIYHDGLDAWKTEMIKPIKDKFPKV